MATRSLHVGGIALEFSPQPPPTNFGEPGRTPEGGGDSSVHPCSSGLGDPPRRRTLGLRHPRPPSPKLTAAPPPRAPPASWRFASSSHSGGPEGLSPDLLRSTRGPAEIARCHASASQGCPAGTDPRTHTPAPRDERGGAGRPLHVTGRDANVATSAPGRPRPRPQVGGVGCLWSQWSRSRLPPADSCCFLFASPIPARL